MVTERDRFGDEIKRGIHFAHTRKRCHTFVYSRLETQTREPIPGSSSYTLRETSFVSAARSPVPTNHRCSTL
ncbi:hypothetical protein WN48_09364 [Eufriesea mexicana]|nr:hypothetical protein WN48_09364 [Eufriesea mexicana]